MAPNVTLLDLVNAVTEHARSDREGIAHEIEVVRDELAA
jgi:hypothetical protein